MSDQSMSSSDDVSPILDTLFEGSGYVIGNRIGVGATGSAHLITNPDGVQYVLKVCPNDPAFYPEGQQEKSEKGFSSPQGEKSPHQEEEADPDDTSDMADLQREKRVLRRLRGCPHIVQSGDFSNDPLSPQVPKRANEPTEWLNVEYFHNGTLDDMMELLTINGGEPLPNRVLWRFWMCLLRASIEMLYHESNPGIDWETVDLGTLQDKPMGILTHGDMHCGNVCVDVMNGESPEHCIAPKLKLIDFGNARDMTPEAKEQRQKSLGVTDEPDEIAVFECAYVMVSLLTLTPGTTLVFGDDFDMRYNGTATRCIAGVLNQRGQELISQGVDSDLVALICLCRAKNPEERPGLLQIALTVQSAIKGRDRKFYGGKKKESNRGCIDLMEGLLIKSGFAEGELDFQLPDESDEEEDGADGNRDTMKDDEAGLPPAGSNSNDSGSGGPGSGGPGSGGPGSGGPGSSPGPNNPGGSSPEGPSWRDSRWSPYGR